MLGTVAGKLIAVPAIPTNFNRVALMRLTRLAFANAAGLTAILMVAVVSGASGQVQVGFTAGINIPTRDRLIREFGGVNGLPVSYPILERWQVGAFVMQGRIVRWTPGRIGIEGTLGISPGNMNTRDSTNRVREIRSTTIMTSLRMPVRLSKRTSSLLWHASPGIAYLRYVGPAWDGYRNLGHPAGVVAVGGRGRAGRWSPWWFRFEFEDWMSRSSFRQAGDTYKPQFYHTITFGFGAVYQFGSRR